VILLAAVATIFALATAAPSHAATRAGCARAAQASIADAAPRVVGSAVLCLVNAERGAHGLRALAGSAPLRTAAERYSREMVARSFFDHVSPSGSTLSSRVRVAGYRNGRTLGETIGWGTGTLATPASIVSGWMNSPPHRAVILNGRIREAGVGVAAGAPVPAEGTGATFVLDVGAR
jgi:uncharacterized protein YkwD